MSEVAARRGSAPPIPSEIVTMAAFAGAIFFVVVSGAGLSSLLPEHASMWLNAGAYGAPAAIAFAAYWWVAQRM
jgi:hypothetical protein